MEKKTINEGFIGDEGRIQTQSRLEHLVVGHLGFRAGCGGSPRRPSQSS